MGSCINKLIEHLTNVKSLIGKPKVLLLLGSLHYEFEELTKSNTKNPKEFDDYTTKFRLSKHADLMVFQNQPGQCAA